MSEYSYRSEALLHQEASIADPGIVLVTVLLHRLRLATRENLHHLLPLVASCLLQLRLLPRQLL